MCTVSPGFICVLTLFLCCGMGLYCFYRFRLLWAVVGCCSVYFPGVVSLCFRGSFPGCGCRGCFQVFAGCTPGGGTPPHEHRRGSGLNIPKIQKDPKRQYPILFVLTFTLLRAILQQKEVQSWQLRTILNSM